MKIEYTCSGSYAGYSLKKGVKDDVPNDVGKNMVETGKAKEIKKKQKSEKKDAEG